MTVLRIHYAPSTDVLQVEDANVLGEDLLYIPRASPVGESPTGRKLLNAFIRLAEPSLKREEFGKRVVDFARDYGVFNTQGLQSNEETAGAGKLPDQGRSNTPSIPLDQWKTWAENAWAIVHPSAELAADPLKRLHPGNIPEAWLAKGPSGLLAIDLAPGTDLRNVQAAATDEWLRFGQATYALKVIEERPALVVSGRGLEGRIGFELLVAAADRERVNVCSVCGNPFLALRRPKTDSLGSYCDSDRANSAYWMKKNAGSQNGGPEGLGAARRTAVHDACNPDVLGT